MHARYNPEQLTVLNIVPGLICIVLTFSTLFVTTLCDHPRARARHDGEPARDAGTPDRGDDRQDRALCRRSAISRSLLILVASALFFALPIRGSIPLLLGALGLFIACNLALGVTFSTISANQMQAVQLAQFTLMPSFLLSGFMFPFRGMPVWAQWVGQILPTTHAMRIVRGILLKGNGWSRSRPSFGRSASSPSW